MCMSCGTSTSRTRMPRKRIKPRVDEFWGVNSVTLGLCGKLSFCSDVPLNTTFRCWISEYLEVDVLVVFCVFLFF